MSFAIFLLVLELSLYVVDTDSTKVVFVNLNGELCCILVAN